ncbi:pentapeptide repeat-containing protein [Streptomyces sp. NPDC006638]|uniref:pentapeptide repeat-containing protein n=1 Tax=Streptomyces sp. NPDC006638 TaxID=3157183 RepID=UPI00339EF086
MVAAVVAVVGLWYSNIQARDDRKLNKEGQITDRYTAAVGNLGQDKMEVRLGGIYALQRIMQDSRRDQPTIANVLATYIRIHAAKRPAKGQDIPADVAAALTVLAARDTAHDDTFRLDLRAAKLPNVEPGPSTQIAALRRSDLRGTDLSGAYLDLADLNGTDLSAAHLNGTLLTNTDLGHAVLDSADLGGADLGGADLSDASLIDADLSGAFLNEVNLSDAVLSGADLTDAQLHNTNLKGANLSGADLRDTDLSSVVNLTKSQVDSARVNGKTRLPARLR